MCKLKEVMINIFEMNMAYMGYYYTNLTPNLTSQFRFVRKVSGSFDRIQFVLHIKYFNCE